MFEHYSNIKNTNHIKNIISQTFLRNKLIHEISHCINAQTSGCWYTSDIQLHIQNGDIVCCITTQDWLWIVRRISVIYDISDEYMTATLQREFDFSVFPFLESKTIRDFILARTEHNFFVLCHTIDQKIHSKKYVDGTKFNEIQFNETKFNEILSKTIEILTQTGGFKSNISIPNAHPITELLWKHRYKKNMYEPLLSSIIPSNRTLEDILLTSDQEPYHTLQKLAIQCSKYKEEPTRLVPSSHFFVSQKNLIQRHHIFETILLGIIEYMNTDMTYDHICSWFAYHMECLPIESQVLLYRNSIENCHSHTDQNSYYQSLHSLFFRLSKSKLLRQKRNWIIHQLLQVQ